MTKDRQESGSPSRSSHREKLQVTVNPNNKNMNQYFRIKNSHVLNHKRSPTNHSVSYGQDKVQLSKKIVVNRKQIKIDIKIIDSTENLEELDAKINKTDIFRTAKDSIIDNRVDLSMGNSVISTSKIT
jgi:hypothetical protein